MKEWSVTVYKSINKPAIKACISLGISPNQITIFNHIITLTFGCYFFSRGEYAFGLAGLGVCLINGFLDYLDGDLAKQTGRTGQLGVWLDSGFDVILQNAVMGAIAVGCYAQGLSVWWVVLFFISNSANNFVSFNYNQRFGFDSDKGNELFREYMDKKPTIINKIFKNIIDPTSSYLALTTLTFRYWIALGALFNIMPICFIMMTFIGWVKWIVMYCLYALHLGGSIKLHVLQGLSYLDQERNEFYKLRCGQKI